MTSRTKYAAALSLSLAAGFAIGWAFGMHGPQSFDGCSGAEVLPTEEQPSVAKARKGGGSAVSSSREGAGSNRAAPHDFLYCLGSQLAGSDSI